MGRVSVVGLFPDRWVRVAPDGRRNGPDKTLFHLTLHSTFATRSVVISSRAMDP